VPGHNDPANTGTSLERQVVELEDNLISAEERNAELEKRNGILEDLFVKADAGRNMNGKKMLELLEVESMELEGTRHRDKERIRVIEIKARG
jgi:hypothetical protein